MGLFFMFIGSSFATDYVLFYGDGNFDSEDVKDFFVEKEIENDYNIMKYDIYFQDEAWEYFTEKIQDYDISSSNWEVPILIVEENGYAKIFTGKLQVKNYFNNPNTFTYLKKVSIPDTQVGDYIKLLGKKKKDAEKVVEIIEEKLQEISKGNIYTKIKLYEAIFVKLENIMEKKKSLQTKMLVYYVKINMVIEYLQLINKTN